MNEDNEASWMKLKNDADIVSVGGLHKMATSDKRQR
jgi:hypothetical protein